MDTQLAPFMQNTPEGEAAAEILGRCVHCGFCTATCPTYQLLGDELDGPRGRIYLMKQMFEGAEVGQETLTHLDRCLTCRSCETTCPSGVEYGRLVDIGRSVAQQRIERPLGQKLLRGLLREGLNSPLFAPAMTVGRSVRGLLPAALKEKIPQGRPAGPGARARHDRRLILPSGCVQPSMLPGIDGATQRVMDQLGFSAAELPGQPASRCCGAIRQHLSDPQGALSQVKQNVDAWYPLLASGAAEGILLNASGCAVMVKDYGHLLASDPEYAERAARVSASAMDPIEWLEPLLPQIQQLLAQLNRDQLTEDQAQLVYHAPCTQQHGLKLRGTVERFLTALGARLQPVADAHLCCGSAGTYSVLQPELSHALRTRKLQALEAQAPICILSANVGCITHLAAAAGRPVLHWIEWLDDRLSGRLNSPQG
jgi:glycolate oxidase iron-sulfur subunit